MSVLRQFLGGLPGAGGVDVGEAVPHLDQAPHDTARLDFFQVLEASYGMRRTLVDLTRAARKNWTAAL